ncbi:hypothetical protein BK709_04805 [Bacillus thuringiensis serovar shandongiensis]|uniref:hypothetical protein n=1 Tax=Bacillus toyonensis TaxID=155322 RepID=UPI000B4300B4|nr:hypothetical protein [Bacillus toyonensis]MEC2390237.1 hypothetical protein [Bacillus toyonensis]OTX32062.1 hypothetical protein BK717_20185 [Bacillus thuringiensis serovar malayensis]OUB10828.1 hypothetical protein BK709_04805 [Bacillus thuringiensis serovar shandongiensis]
MDEIKFKYKVKVGRLWVSSFSVGYDCPFPVIDLAGSEGIAKKFDSEEKAKEIADLVNGELVPIKYKVKQEVSYKWTEVELSWE